MDFEKKLEELNIDKGQLILFTIIGLVIVFILVGLFSGGSEEQEKAEVKEVEILSPEDKVKTEYKTKLDAYSKENQETETTVSLDFERGGVFGEGQGNLTKKELLEKSIDSMMENRKFSKEPVNSNNTAREKQSNQNTTKNVAPKKEEVDPFEGMDDFFTKTPPTPETIKVSANSDSFIYVAVKGDQTIKVNDRVNLILTRDALIEGKLYKKNTFLYAIAKFGTNRIYLDITNISNVVVDLKAYDSQDGNIGIYTETESLTNEVFNEASDEAVGDINVGTIPVGNTLKKIFRKKTKVQKVTLLNNYKLILKTAT